MRDIVTTNDALSSRITHKSRMNDFDKRTIENNLNFSHKKILGKKPTIFSLCKI